MEEGNLAVLVDAKTEYTKQLINILKMNIYFSINKLFVDSKKICKENNKENMVLNKFQELLSNIPNWNQDIINNEYQIIINNSKCDWLEELITAVFVSHTRILTSINFNKNKNKINLKIPKTTHFIHKCFVDIARNFWKNSYLFDDRVNNYELQKNRRECESIIEISINETIRRELPVKHILKEYLGEDYKEDDNNFDENIANSNKHNLKQMVMREIHNCSKEQLDQLKFVLDNNKTPETVLSPPVVEPPVVEPPVAEPPVVTVPVEALPVVTVPVEAPPVVTVPVEAPPVVTVQVEAPPVVTVPVEAPQVITVPVEAPPVVTVPVEAPPVVTVQVEAPQVVTSPLQENSSKNDINLDNLISEELQFDSLNLDDMDDLTNVEEVYLDSMLKSNNNETIKINTDTNTLKQNSNDIKTIPLNVSFKDSGKKQDDNIEIINKYKSKDFSFFSDE
jgi:hypothetical protein